ncbi:auxin transport protein BIG-like, partial [Cicer arietinum]
MANNLDALVDALSQPSAEFLHKLRSDDAVRLNLDTFYCLLRRGLESSGDDDTLQFQSWTDSQIHAISSLANSIASSSRSLSVEQAEGVLVAIVQQSIEFALCYLEKSGFDDDDLGIQTNMIHLLEIAVVDGMNMVVDILQPTTASTLVDLLPIVDDCRGNYVDDYRKCRLEGFQCSMEEKSMNWLLKTLASKHMPHDRQESGFSEQTFYQYLNTFVFLSQHWAVVHGKCTPRLILLCSKLAKVQDVFDEWTLSQNFRRRLSFILRMLKILGSLMTDVPYVEYDASLMRAVASFTDTLSNMFRIKLEFVNTYATIEGSFDSIVLMVMEEFLHVVHVIFGNSNVAQNIQACFVASIFESLDSSVWIYDKTAPISKPPLAFFPRFVICTLKLINDLKKQRHQIPFERKDFDVELVGSSTDAHSSSISCLAHHGYVPLLKGYTFEELIKLIFPASSQCIENLMQLALFLHSEGLKLRQKMERSHSSLAKVAGPSEIENAVCHEDEALFGDLFSETGRSVGSSDGCEQPPAAALVSNSSNQNMPIQAVIELLNFLKTCVFSTEWHPPLFVDACSKLSSRDIDILL